MVEIVARTVKGFCQAYGVGRSRAYELIKAGRLRTAKEGERTLVLEDSAREWLASIAVPTAVPTDARRKDMDAGGR